ncbi:MAG: hypothetical protein HY900_18395 [Deltaproteobacteria bacterium]|nr:hypothetical protein [Deltaproteobacteria bacterium]
MDPDGRLLVGLVRLDPEKREVTLPAAINMAEGLLEYALVSTRGKLHESLLVTPAEPLDLQVALLLLGLKGNPTLQFQGDPVEIRVEWTADGAPRQERIERLIVNRRLGGPMPATDWIYTGSVVRNGIYVPQIDRSIVATYHDPSAIINNPDPDGGSDKVWFVNTEAAPPRGTPVTVTIRVPAKEAKSK